MFSGNGFTSESDMTSLPVFLDSKSPLIPLYERGKRIGENSRPTAQYYEPQGKNNNKNRGNYRRIGI
jgi:hypothetical protein